MASSKSRKLSPVRSNADTDSEIDTILDSVQGHVERIVDFEADAPPSVSARDVVAGRARFDSFHEAETERLPASLVLPTPTTSSSSISPIVVAQPDGAASPRPDEAQESGAAETASAPALRTRPSSAPWLLAIFAAAGAAATLAFVEARRPRAPASSLVAASRGSVTPAPPPAAATLPSTATPTRAATTDGGIGAADASP